MKKVIGITIILLGCFFLASCAQKDSEDPKEVATAYIDAQLAKNWGEVCDLFDSATQESIAKTFAFRTSSKEEKSCAETLLNLPEIEQTSFSSTVGGIWVSGEVLERGNIAKVSVVKEIGGQKAKGFIALKKVSGKWKVDYEKNNLPVIDLSKLKKNKGSQK